jgi:FtsP/CotA-like multicopper oxidase with cupredoxin domain
MSKIKLLIFMSLVAALVAHAPVAALAQLPPYADPGGVPHYFGPYGNWAFSPLPKGPVAVVTPVDGGSGYSATPTVTIDDAYGTATAPADVTAVVTGGVITGFTINNGGAGYSAPVVTITDATGTGATADATIGGALTGGMRKFVDRVPLLGPAGANNIIQAHGAGQYIPVAVPENRTFSGQAADYYEIALVEFSEKMHSDLPVTRLRGYVQLATAAVPGAGIALKNPDGSTILKPDGTQALAVDYPHFLGPVIVAQGRVHGIPNTLPTDPGYPKPVRIKFYNLLPTGAGGDLFLPVDETIMGAGYGPAGPGMAGEKYTQNRATIHLHGNNTVWISDGNVHQWITPAAENTPYPEGVSVRNVPDMPDPGPGAMTFFYTNAQSARLQFYHDHAMAITRLNVYAGEAAGYVMTDAVEQDMINGTNVSGVNISPGTTTLFKKVLPDIGIPLVIQDRTFVEAATIFAQDPTWNWGTGPRDTNGKITAAVTGDLWYPHVYMTVQNPWDLTGTNAFGRWHYGPWFNPPVPTCVNGLPVGCIEVGPVPNEYYDPINAPWEPPFRPGNPNPSIPGESFLDTQVVNGTAYPYLEVEPKAYRFRVLNASNDRFVNLQLYVAADKTTPTTPGTIGTVLCDGTIGPLVENCTEVKMVPISVAPANQLADTPSGIPDPTTKGPDWILIGTEGGFMPKPVVVPQQPIGYNLDMAYFAFGIVNQHSLFLGSAERADVVVDFTGQEGKTFILYNDSPAPVPAGAAPYDYYTGNGNQMDGGGAPNTQPGYGPNTRTIMQIRVNKLLTTPTTDVTLANLEAVFKKTASKRGVFEVSQDPIIIPQAAYNSAYDAITMNPASNGFPSTAAGQYFQIADTQKTFQPINENGVLQPAVTLPLEMKAMHDEMGGVYDTLFGRMSGMLGLSLQNSPNHVLIPYGLASPPTDLVKGSVEGTPIGVMPDGTQIWRIFHNGVDTHTIHTHLFHTQLINRVDQSGQIVGEPVSPIELGWKDTFRVNPLEITYLAMRPTVPTPAQVPFEVPNSVRLIDPTLPEGATLIPPPPAGWFDPNGIKIQEILNHYVNFGWEYVWHCHILSHEEMDMMHSLVFAVPPKAPSSLAVSVQGSRATLTWTDNSLNETSFKLQRAADPAFMTGLTTFTLAENVTTYADSTIQNNRTYSYRVLASNLVGDTQVYPGSLGFPVISADSVFSNTVSIGTAAAVPDAPTLLGAIPQSGPQVSLTWTDNATNETGFVVERCTGAGCTNFAQIAVPGPRNNRGSVTYVDTTVTANNSYSYRVKAVNAAGSSAYTNTATVTLPAIPAAPTNFRVSVVKANGNNYWAMLNWASATNPTNFTIQRATNATFTRNLSSFTPAGNLRTLTQTVTRNTTYYYRIRANSLGGSSAWVNALPFPIRTGP